MLKTSSEGNKRENLCKLGIFCSAVGIKYDFKNIIFSILKYFITGHPNYNKAAFNLKNLCKIKYSIIKMKEKVLNARKSSPIFPVANVSGSKIKTKNGWISKSLLGRNRKWSQPVIYLNTLRKLK